MFGQISSHLVAQSSWHVKLASGPMNVGDCIQQPCLRPSSTCYMLKVLRSFPVKKPIWLVHLSVTLTFFDNGTFYCLFVYYLSFCRQGVGKGQETGYNPMERDSVAHTLGNTALETASKASLVLRTFSAITSIPEDAWFWLLGLLLPALCWAVPAARWPVHDWD